MLAFNTLADAHKWFINSDFYHWTWFPEFDEGQLVQFLYCHSDGERSGKQLVMLFLQCRGQDLTRYFDSAERQRAGCCPACGMTPWQSDTDVPQADDDWRWWAIANEHAYDCTWVETRAYQVAAS